MRTIRVTPVKKRTPPEAFGELDEWKKLVVYTSPGVRCPHGNRDDRPRSGRIWTTPNDVVDGFREVNVQGMEQPLVHKDKIAPG